MRPGNRSLFASALLGASALLSSLSACDWREFDDLADTTWVDTTGAPNGVDSSDFAVALAEANNESAATPETKQLAVVSRSKLTLAFLSFDGTGKITTKQSISLDSNSGGPFEVLPQSPIYASDPRSGRVAVTAGGKIAMGEANRSTLDVATAPNSGSSAGLTFLEINAKTYVAIASERGIALLDLTAPTTTTALCTGPLAATTRVVALGTVRVGAAEQLVVWSQPPNSVPAELNSYTVTVTGATCAMVAAGAAIVDAVSSPTRSDYPLIEGARIVTIPGTESVAISDPLKNQVLIAALGATRTTTTFAAPDVISLAVGKIDGDTYAFAGASNQDIDGTSNAGRMQVTRLTGAVPVGEVTPTLTLRDASPGTEERFGRAVAVVPFADATSPIIVVGADDEMFTYFRTSLYPERRTP
jgi:hypothetical protein